MWRSIERSAEMRAVMEFLGSVGGKRPTHNKAGGMQPLLPPIQLIPALQNQYNYHPYTYFAVFYMLFQNPTVIGMAFQNPIVVYTVVWSHGRAIEASSRCLVAS
jgi:hypothetical protein